VNGDILVKVVAIISLASICVAALMKGIDSVLVGTVSAVIGGIAGYQFGKSSKGGESSGGEAG